MKGTLWCLHGAVGMAADWRGLALPGWAVKRVDLWRFLDCCPMSMPEFRRALNREAAARAEQLDERFTGRPVPFSATEDEFARITEEELDALPGWLTAKIEESNVAIGIEDEQPGQPRVLGLYQRIGRESQITLYRRPIIRAAGSPEGLRRQIHATLLHELGHLFGMSEEDLDDYEIGNHPRPGAAPIRDSEIPR